MHTCACVFVSNADIAERVKRVHTVTGSNANSARLFFSRCLHVNFNRLPDGSNGVYTARCLVRQIVHTDGSNSLWLNASGFDFGGP